MPTETIITMTPQLRRDAGESRLPHPIRISVPWLRHPILLDHVTLLARIAMAGELIAFLAGIWWFATHGLGWFEVAVFAVMFMINALGISVGYHRMLSHRTLQAKPWVRLVLGIAGAIGMQGPILYWVSIHRKHHRYPDALEDPHTPRPRGTGRFAVLRGAFHGFVGWTLTGSYCMYPEYIKDLQRDAVVRFIDRYYALWVVGGIVFPGLVGWAWYGTWQGYVACAFAGGPIRLFFTLTGTWYVNSVAHLLGNRPFVTSDNARNNYFVNIFAVIGEGWHNNHHAFPRSAKLSAKPGQLDIGYLFILLLKGMGLVDRVLIASDKAVIDKTIDMAGTETP